MISYIKKDEQIIDISNGETLKLTGLTWDESSAEYKRNSNPYHRFYLEASAQHNGQDVSLLASTSGKNLLVTKEELNTLFSRYNRH
jgi:hypothetical protein